MRHPARSYGGWTVIVAAGFLALLIFGLVARNDSWIYSRIGWLDPWTYVGFGYSYDHPLFAANDYKIGRLPWVLAEFYTRHLLDPVESQYVLQLGSLFLQGLFFYLAVTLLLGPIPALVGAAFLVSLPLIHGAGGADYNTTFSGPLYALTFYVLTVAVKSNRGVLALLFGLCLGLLLHTNFLYLNLISVLLIHYVRLRLGSAMPLRLASFSLFGLVAAAGVLLATAGLAAINHAYGRSWLFFKDLFNFFMFFLADSARQKQWWLPWGSKWYADQAYMGILAAGLFVAIGTVFIAYRAHDDRARRLQIVNLCGQYLVGCAIWVIWQSFGHTALQPYYFVYPLWILLAGVVSSAVACAGPFRVRVEIWSVAATMLIGCVLPYWLSSWDVKLGPAAASYSLCLYLAVLGGGLLLIWFRIRIGIYAMAFLIGLANAIVNDNLANYRAAPCTDSRDAQLALIAAYKQIATLDPDFSRNVYVWRNPDNGDSVSLSKCSLMPARFFGDSLTWSGFAYLDDARPYKPIGDISAARLREATQGNPIIVMVTDDPALIAQMQNRFVAIGWRFSSIQKILIRQGPISLSMSVFK